VRRRFDAEGGSHRVLIFRRTPISPVSSSVKWIPACSRAFVFWGWLRNFLSPEDARQRFVLSTRWCTQRFISDGLHRGARGKGPTQLLRRLEGCADQRRPLPAAEARDHVARRRHVELASVVAGMAAANGLLTLVSDTTDPDQIANPYKAVRWWLWRGGEGFW
jgi:hypothetical protein